MSYFWLYSESDSAWKASKSLSISAPTKAGVHWLRGHLSRILSSAHMLSGVVTVSGP